MSLQVAVIGGGIGGLSAALNLLNVAREMLAHIDIRIEGDHEHLILRRQRKRDLTDRLFSNYKMF